MLQKFEFLCTSSFLFIYNTKKLIQNFILVKSHKIGSKSVNKYPFLKQIFTYFITAGSGSGVAILMRILADPDPDADPDPKHWVCLYPF